jgi:hypothetical protein
MVYGELQTIIQSIMDGSKESFDFTYAGVDIDKKL